MPSCVFVKTLRLVFGWLVLLVAVSSACVNAADAQDFGPARSDPRNPIHKVFDSSRFDLWSLRPPKGDGPKEKPTEGSSPSATLDDFVRKRLADRRLASSPVADPRAQLRRVTFDLTGLPPTYEEVEAFARDPSLEAYKQIVDRLLDSPAYGERQARLWLDVVRYADTNGYERDEFRPSMWRYRDYVARAFQNDKPYDRFVREQLAGDHLVEGEPRSADECDALLATGFLRLGQWDSTAAIFQEEERLRAEMLADLTNTTAAAFLGLTMSCCQCHDHKYDPLTQDDHYRLRAHFARMKPRDDVPVAPQAVASSDEPPAWGVQEANEHVPIHVLAQGDFASRGAEMHPGFPTVLGASVESSQPPRLRLANWIVSPDNPWATRVIVNRIWQQHFGVGLVATANDFGHSGAKPTHPELLDWLAVDFQRHGWSIKRLHRVIVTSDTYRQRSQSLPASLAIDPDNHCYWRQNIRRLDAETIRDSLLAVSGQLQRDYRGRPIWPAVPEELLQAQPSILEAIEGKDDGRKQGWFTDGVEKTRVRSLYLVRKRCLPIPFLQAFDLPDSTVSCARRDTTVVAPQALLLLNGDDSLQAAQSLARRIEQATDASPEDAAYVTRVFQIALARQPTDDERQLALDLLQRHAAHYGKSHDAPESSRRALVDLCRAILNLNEFLYLD